MGSLWSADNRGKVTQSTFAGRWVESTEENRIIHDVTTA